MPGEHELRITLATALRERDTYRDDAAYFKASYQRKLADEKRLLESASATVAERDALRTALTEVNDLLMSVPPGEDWRAVVREKVVVALFGEAAWQTK
jgi:hypothetical protein